jgi:hypothetical protein
LGKPDALVRLRTDSNKLATEYANATELRSKAIEQSGASLPLSVATSSHPQQWYTGTYINKASGTLEVSYEQGQLRVRSRRAKRTTFHGTGGRVCDGFIPREYRSGVLHRII